MAEEISVQPEPTIPSRPQAQSLKIVAFALFGLLLLSGTTYAGYWYGVKSSNLKSQISKPFRLHRESSTKSGQPKTQNLTPTALPIISSTSTPNSTADWRIYRNSEYNFEFKYPTNLSFGPVGAPVPLAFSLGAVTFSLYPMDIFVI